VLTYTIYRYIKCGSFTNWGLWT